MAADVTPPTVLHYDKVDWDDPTRGGVAPPKELVKAARKTGARRKKVARGEAGFYMNRSTLPPGFRVPAHSHDHNELMVVLRGGCTFDDGVGELGPDDSIAIHGGFLYGFTCGADGMEFLTIRTGEASVDLVKASAGPGDGGPE
jgi:quercetin dioxygenase-like cupin family protein